MRIKTFNSEPILEYRFLNSGKGPGDFYVDQLPVHLGTVDSLPAGLDAIVATADLQGREQFEDGDGGPPRLLGEVLPDKLVGLLDRYNLAPDRVGVVLAGDFYTVPNLDKRGGTGDVTRVWKSFARSFRWVAGVAGNHDLFDGAVEPKSRLASNAHFLESTFSQIDNLRVAGVGGIVGNPRKPQRKDDQQFIASLEQLLTAEPDLLIMHDGPNDERIGQRGSPMIRMTVERLPRTLLIRGHAHWTEPLIELANSTQVLNVDCRVAILTR